MYLQQETLHTRHPALRANDSFGKKVSCMITWGNSTSESQNVRDGLVFTSFELLFSCVREFEFKIIHLKSIRFCQSNKGLLITHAAYAVFKMHSKRQTPNRKITSCIRFTQSELITAFPSQVLVPWMNSFFPVSFATVFLMEMNILLLLHILCNFQLNVSLDTYQCISVKVWVPEATLND